MYKVACCFQLYPGIVIPVLRVNANYSAVNNVLANIYINNKLNSGKLLKFFLLDGDTALIIFIGELVFKKYFFKISTGCVLHWSICQHSCFSIINIEFVFC